MLRSALDDASRTAHILDLVTGARVRDTGQHVLVRRARAPALAAQPTVTHLNAVLRSPGGRAATATAAAFRSAILTRLLAQTVRGTPRQTGSKRQQATSEKQTRDYMTKTPHIAPPVLSTAAILHFLPEKIAETRVQLRDVRHSGRSRSSPYPMTASPAWPRALSAASHAFGSP